MSQVIVLVSDTDDIKHGEITVVDDGVQAEHLVETLLEAGFEQHRIRVFSGSTLPMQVSYRPVVSFENSDELIGSDEGETVEIEAPIYEQDAPELVGAEVGGDRKNGLFTAFHAE